MMLGPQASTANHTRILAAGADRTRMVPGLQQAAQADSALKSWMPGRTGLYAGGGVVGLLVLLAGIDLAAPDAAANPYTYVKMAGAKLPVIGKEARSHCSSIFNSSGCWGAIVEKNGSIFARVEESRKEEAESNARQLCENRGGGATGCRQIGLVSKNECWVLAEVPNKPSNWRASIGPTFKEASAAATSDCERNFGYCRVAVTACADGSNKH